MDTGFFNTIREFKFTSRKHRISDEDAVDRVNSFYSPVIIMLISFIIGAKMYLVGEPMQCWVPKEFHAGWEQYTENYCWVKNTYYVPLNESRQVDKITREKEELTYYQWVPFMLCIQALMFYLPSAFWKLLNWQSGVHISDLVETSINSLESPPAEREEAINQLVHHFEISLLKQHPTRSGLLVKIKRLLFRCFLCGYSKTGSYLTTTYMFIKILYVANVVGQFFLLNNFLRTDYKFYGLEILRDLINGHDWQHSGHFPRVTLCDFNITHVGYDRPFTVQCVLVVNLFNEKAYVFLWFFLVLVAVATIIDALAWLLWTLFSRRRYASVRKYLQISNSEEKLFRRFVDDHLRADGVFVLRIISKNAGDPNVFEVVKRLWNKYCRNWGHKAAASDSPPFSSDSSEGSPLLNEPDMTKGVAV